MPRSFFYGQKLQGKRIQAQKGSLEKASNQHREVQLHDVCKVMQVTSLGFLWSERLETSHDRLRCSYAGQRVKPSDLALDVGVLKASDSLASLSAYRLYAPSLFWPCHSAALCS